MRWLAAPGAYSAERTANGTIAIGDQTNDVNVDGAVRIKSVERLCPEYSGRTQGGGFRLSRGSIEC